MILLISAAYAGISGAPWVPTWKRDLKRIENLLELNKDDRFVELGCGNGRVCRHLSKNTGAASTGVELSILQVLIGKFQNFFGKHSQVRIVLSNAFAHDLSDYTAVYLFLMPETYKKIKPKLEKELKPGTKVVSYVWPIPEWDSVKVDEIKGSPNLYLYKI